MTMRFLHTADWQIGMRAAHVGAVGARVRDERLAAAQRVVEAAHQHGANFLLAAGDTFEDNAVDRILVQKVADILASFRGPVYLIAGNHDPLAPGSVWDHPAWQQHDNLRLAGDSERIEVPGGVLFASSLREKESPIDPTAWIAASDERTIAIGMAHGSIDSVAGEYDYPIARDAAQRAGVDYLALGHWHSYAHFPDGAGVVRMAYSGTHETTKFGETDSGNVLLVEIAERGAPPQITPIRTGGLVWQTIDREVRGLADLEQLRAEVEGATAPASTLLNVRLRGLLPAGAEQHLARLEELVTARYCFGRFDASQLLPAPEDDRWIQELPPGVLREVAARLQSWSDPSQEKQRPDGATPQVASRALLDLYRLMQEVNT